MKISRAGGYDPKLDHPNNQDPTLPPTSLFRTITVEGVRGRVTLVENEDDDTASVTADPRVAPRALAQVGAVLAPDQLWKLGCDIIGWFGGAVLSPDEWRAKADELRAKIEAVLQQNEARCLDDGIDRGVVVRELLAALMPTP